MVVESTFFFLIILNVYYGSKDTIYRVKGGEKSVINKLSQVGTLQLQNSKKENICDTRNVFDNNLYNYYFSKSNTQKSPKNI